jgi:hypothetical protein
MLANQHVLDGRRHRIQTGRTALFDGRHRHRDVLCKDRLRVAVEGHHAGQHLVQDAAQRVLIRASVDLAAHRLFRRHVVRRAHDRAGQGQAVVTTAVVAIDGRLTDRRHRVGTDHRYPAAARQVGVGGRHDVRAPRDAKIDDLDAVLGAVLFDEKDVFGLEIAMDDALVVNRLQAGGDLHGDATGAQRIQRPLGDNPT